MIDGRGPNPLGWGTPELVDLGSIRKKAEKPWGACQYLSNIYNLYQVSKSVIWKAAASYLEAGCWYIWGVFSRGQQREALVQLGTKDARQSGNRTWQILCKSPRHYWVWGHHEVLESSQRLTLCGRVRVSLKTLWKPQEEGAMEESWSLAPRSRAGVSEEAGEPTDERAASVAVETPAY